MKKTIGGDRLGSGNNLKTELNNYERSTHNLGNVWRSTMAPGLLVPFYKKLALNGDTWTIDLTSLVRTSPAIGPLFGSYKLQMDMFTVPIRLYNGILHNNPLSIGTKMKNVKLPQVTLVTTENNPNYIVQTDLINSQINQSSLLAYLGYRGIGGYKWGSQDTTQQVTLKRAFNAVPILGYYDIFKNYYSNKQEKFCYMVSNKVSTSKGNITGVSTFTIGQNPKPNEWTEYKWTTAGETTTTTTLTSFSAKTEGVRYAECIVLNGSILKISGDAMVINSSFTFTLKAVSGTTTTFYLKSDGTLSVNGLGTWEKDNNNGDIYIYFGTTASLPLTLTEIKAVFTTKPKYTTRLQSIELSQFDKMREYILNNSLYGSALNVTDVTDYMQNCCEASNGYLRAGGPLQGLMCKTYQSDYFNNFLDTAFVEEVNSISQVSVANNSFSIDSLNLANKVYKMLNRVIVSGGTYQDWQEAVYGEESVSLPEIPMYCGGMSGTISFEEVVSTANTYTTSNGESPLGTLGGKGKLATTKGGHVEIHIKEPSYIIGICSITPLIDYGSGNDFDITEIESLDDLHKPALDQIGWQDLLLERADYRGTQYNADTDKWEKIAQGKIPAWLDYMTSVNQVYGEFTESNKLKYMVLLRDYDISNVEGEDADFAYADFTTYVNPTKYNYQFADTSLTAQNFWVQIGIDAIARRKMSAKIIPNL